VSFAPALPPRHPHPHTGPHTLAAVCVHTSQHLLTLLHLWPVFPPSMPTSAAAGRSHSPREMRERCQSTAEHLSAALNPRAATPTDPQPNPGQEVPARALPDRRDCTRGPVHPLRL
jgi:hypothetical protein